MNGCLCTVCYARHTIWPWKLGYRRGVVSKRTLSELSLSRVTTRELRESKCQPTGTGLRGNRLEDPGIRAPTVPRRRSDAPRRRKRRVNGIHSGWRSRRRRRNQARVSRRSSRPPGELRHSCRDRSLEPRIEGSRSTLPRVDGSESVENADVGSSLLF